MEGKTRGCNYYATVPKYLSTSCRQSFLLSWMHKHTHTHRCLHFFTYNVWSSKCILNKQHINQFQRRAQSFPSSYSFLLTTMHKEHCRKNKCEVCKWTELHLSHACTQIHLDSSLHGFVNHTFAFLSSTEVFVDYIHCRSLNIQLSPDKTFVEHQAEAAQTLQKMHRTSTAEENWQALPKSYMLHQNVL